MVVLYASNVKRCAGSGLDLLSAAEPAEEVKVADGGEKTATDTTHGFSKSAARGRSPYQHQDLMRAC